jgi:hypothetical protein
MSDLPSHPDSGPAGHPSPDVSEPPIVSGSRRRKALVIAAAVGVLVLVAVLHLTGVIGTEGH